MIYIENFKNKIENIFQTLTGLNLKILMPPQEGLSPLQAYIVVNNIVEENMLLQIKCNLSIQHIVPVLKPYKKYYSLALIMYRILKELGARNIMINFSIDEPLENEKWVFNIVFMFDLLAPSDMIRNANIFDFKGDIQDIFSDMGNTL